MQAIATKAPPDEKSDGRQPVDKSRYPMDIGWERRSRSCGNNQKNSPTTSETPPKAPETEKDPQGRRRILKRISILDMAEKPAQAMIQGVRINIVKIKKTMGRC